MYCCVGICSYSAHKELVWMLSAGWYQVLGCYISVNTKYFLGFEEQSLTCISPMAELFLGLGKLWVVPFPTLDVCFLICLHWPLWQEPLWVCRVSWHTGVRSFTVSLSGLGCFPYKCHISGVCLFQRLSHFSWLLCYRLLPKRSYWHLFVANRCCLEIPPLSRLHGLSGYWSQPRHLSSISWLACLLFKAIFLSHWFGTLLLDFLTLLN